MRRAGLEPATCPQSDGWCGSFGQPGVGLRFRPSSGADGDAHRGEKPFGCLGVVPWSNDPRSAPTERLSSGRVGDEQREISGELVRPIVWEHVAILAVRDEVGGTADLVRDDDREAEVHRFVHDDAPGFVPSGC